MTILKLLYPLVGIMGLVWAVSLIRGIRQTKLRLSETYLTASRHSEKLGLQATIGADLRALLQGWVWTKRYSLGAWIPYWVITACLLGGTFLRLHDGERISQWANGKIPWELVRGPSPFATVIILGALVVVAAIGNYWIQWGGAETTKVLLVVDDLDRCKPEHLLSVVESIKLLIEDAETRDRVQVAMLLEEDILKHAIYDKYGALADHDRSSILHTSYDADTLVRENCEKLFTAHLRLPLVGNAEFRDLVETFSGRPQEHAKSKSGSGPHTPSVQASGVTNGSAMKNGTEQAGEHVSVQEVPIGGDKPPIASQTAATSVDTPATSHEPSTVGTTESIAEPQSVPNSLRVLEEFEVDSIVTALGEAADFRRNMGPRAIRAYIFRYQLARLLLQKLGIPWTTKALASALVERALKVDGGSAVRPVKQDASDEQKLRQVVEQVC